MLKRLPYLALLAGHLLTSGVTQAAEFNWKYATVVPPNFPVFGTGANRLAKAIETMSQGRISIKVYGAGELITAFEVFDAVSRGTVEMGQGAPYFWKGKVPAAQLLATVPFGMTAEETNAWVFNGGGIELWREAYAPFGIIPVLAGNTGPQMGGWFNREINSIADLQGLKIRVPGLGGEVYSRAGALTVNLPGSEIFPALQAGTIDAADWIAPFNDLAFGIHKAARYYYWPGWQEPGGTVELLLNQQALESLPEDLRQIVLRAGEAAGLEMLAEFTAYNHQALQTLIEQGVELRQFPPEVIEQFRQLTIEVVEDLVASDPLAAKIAASQRAFMARVLPWQQISVEPIMAIRQPGL
ncbi:MAG: TRAP transporter substrate-binding protein [Immundisolibacteraceae bacterium]|nr:TRAP transporter substrate-binding protein [Immundisolibacteraceae bacterium]